MILTIGKILLVIAEFALLAGIAFFGWWMSHKEVGD